jgi:hypothetical protein
MLTDSPRICSHARRIWYYRRAPLILTLVCGFFSGGILSEIAQGWLPVSPGRMFFFDKLQF